MTRIFIPGLEADICTTVIKKRELPIKGETLVKAGDKVSAADKVCRARLPGDLRICRVAEALGIEPFEALEGFRKLGLKKGGSIKRGEILCEHAGLFGLFKSRFTSPADGTIEFISETNAHIGVREPPRLIEIEAYVSGEVTEVEESKSVFIKTRGALVEGIFGIGGERRGELKILDVPYDHTLGEGDVPGDAEGKILAGGCSPSVVMLKKAAAAGARGLITGSICDSALRGYLGYDIGVALTGDEDICMTVIITEGFGSIPVSERVMKVLQKFDTRVCSINGATQVRAGAVRPEIIIPHQEIFPDKTDGNNTGLAPGSRVRIIRVPYFGLSGEVLDLPADPQRIETGAYCRVLKVKLDEGAEITVPRANVELL